MSHNSRRKYIFIIFLINCTTKDCKHPISMQVQIWYFIILIFYTIVHIDSSLLLVGVHNNVHQFTLQGFHQVLKYVQTMEGYYNYTYHLFPSCTHKNQIIIMDINTINKIPSPIVIRWFCHFNTLFVILWQQNVANNG